MSGSVYVLEGAWERPAEAPQVRRTYRPTSNRIARCEFFIEQSELKPTSPTTSAEYRRTVAPSFTWLVTVKSAFLTRQMKTTGCQLPPYARRSRWREKRALPSCTSVAASSSSLRRALGDGF